MSLSGEPDSPSEAVSSPLFLWVQIWLRTGDVDGFAAYERPAARVLARHGARIERAFRPLDAAEDPALPFEIHLVSFPDQTCLASWQADPERAALQEERERCIARTTVMALRTVKGYDGS
ncbi:MAG: hypothetical protein ACH37Z_09310 [Anaerolineae bacterium]|jgi:uncharacterized protein (DUF1330 family)